MPSAIPRPKSRDCIRTYMQNLIECTGWVEIRMKLDIVLEEEEDGTYSVHCPALKGCHSQGHTRDEAIANIQEAIELYLEVAGEIAKRAAAGRSGSSLLEIAV